MTEKPQIKLDYRIAEVHTGCLCRSLIERELPSIFGGPPAACPLVFTDDDIIYVGEPGKGISVYGVPMKPRGFIELETDRLDLAELLLARKGLSPTRTADRAGRPMVTAKLDRVTVVLRERRTD